MTLETDVEQLLTYLNEIFFLKPDIYNGYDDYNIKVRTDIEYSFGEKIVIISIVDERPSSFFYVYQLSTEKAKDGLIDNPKIDRNLPEDLINAINTIQNERLMLL